MKNLSFDELVESVGVNPATIKSWLKQGLPKNEDGTFFLPLVLSWWEKYIQAKIRTKLNPSAVRLNKAKAKEKEINIKKVQESLLPKDEVVNGIIGGYIRLLSFQNKIPILIISLQNKNSEEQTQILNQWFEELLASQREQFDEIHLSEQATEKLLEVLNLLGKENK